MVDFNSLKSISEIQDAQEGGIDIFTEEEKFILATDSRIGGDIEKVREVAKLLAEVKKAKKTFKKDTDLHDSIQKKQRDNTLAFQVLQDYNEKVSDALAHLELYYGDDGTTGKTEEELKKQISAWEVEKRDKESKRGNKWRQKKSAVKERDGKLLALENRRKSLNKRKILLAVAKWDGTTGPTDDYEVDGVAKKLSATTIDATKIHDYSGTGLTSDSPPTYAGTETFGSLIIKTKGFLQGMDAIVSSKPPRYIKTKINDYHNQRTWNCKNNIACSTNSAGYSFVKILREIGIDKINTVIDNSGNTSTEIDELKKIASNLINCINPDEAITGQKGSKIKGKEYSKVYDEWFKKLLTRKLDEYPYKEAPNWKEYFKLMVKVFPRNGKSYLDDPGNANYILPKSGKKGWKGFLINGYAEDLPNPGTGSGQNLFMSKYVEKNSSSVPQILKDQVSNPYELKNDLNFKSLVGVWWDTYENFFDSTTCEWKDVTSATGVTGIDVTGDERNFLKLQKCLRFAKTLREVLKEVKFIDSIDELDYVILDVASKAEKVSWINPHDKISEKYALKTKADGSNSRHIELIKAIEERKVWSDIIGYNVSSIIDFGILSNVITDDESSISILEEEIKRINEQISKISNEESEFNIAINDLEDRIFSFTRGLDEFKKDPVDKNKTDFVALWDQGKSPNKWTRTEILKLLKWIEVLRGKLTPDEFTADDYENKKTQLEGIQTKIAEFTQPISYYQGLGDTDVERIRRVISEKESTDFSLEKAKSAYDGLANHVKLDKYEQNSLDNITQAIADPTKFKDETPTVFELKPETLKDLLHSTDIPSAETTTKWKNVLEGKGTDRVAANNTIKNEKNIADLINKTGYDKKDSTNDDEKKRFKDWESHLKKHCTGPAKATKDGGDEQWNEFIKKDPKDIIGAILYFEYEVSSDTEKENKRNEMKKAKEDKEKETDVEKVNDSWNVEDQKDMTRYLYRKAIGKKLFDKIETKKQEDPPKTPPSKDSDEKMSTMKEWFGFGSVGKSLLAYGLIFLIIFGGAAAFFWKNITEWWNGPAEEEGEIGEDEKSEDDN